MVYGVEPLGELQKKYFLKSNYLNKNNKIFIEFDTSIKISFCFYKKIFCLLKLYTLSNILSFYKKSLIREKNPSIFFFPEFPADNPS